jgi:hypothetical protein
MNEPRTEATTYCPTCEPTRDPVAEILSVHYCGYHPPGISGADDGRAKVSPEHLYGGLDAGGEGNRDFCAFVHRGRR